jgi:hypothetical protein
MHTGKDAQPQPPLTDARAQADELEHAINAGDEHALALLEGLGPLLSQRVPWDRGRPPVLTGECCVPGKAEHPNPFEPLEVRTQ